MRNVSYGGELWERRGRAACRRCQESERSDATQLIDPSPLSVQRPLINIKANKEHVAALQRHEFKSTRLCRGSRINGGLRFYLGEVKLRDKKRNASVNE